MADIEDKAGKRCAQLAMTSSSALIYISCYMCVCVTAIPKVSGINTTLSPPHRHSSDEEIEDQQTEELKITAAVLGPGISSPTAWQNISHQIRQ